MSCVLVTGGAGYIGSHACKALAAAGLTPVVYDNLSRGHRWAVQWGPLERGDILDRQRLDEVIRRYRPSAVLHFAALCYVGESVGQPAAYYQNNVNGTLSLLEAMRAKGVGRLVFSSSCATYGIPCQAAIREDHPQTPVNPYGWSKLMMEQTLRDYCAAYGLQATALRYFNAAGCDPDGETGAEHDPETRLVPLALRTAAGLHRVLTVYGDDYDTADGTCVRDYAHVSDLADAHLLALHRLGERAGFDAYNLGNGAGFSVREVVDTVERVTGRPVRTVVGPRRPGDPSRLVADTTRARNELGWQPRFGNLESIVETAWRWLTRARPSSAGEGVGGGTA